MLDLPYCVFALARSLAVPIEPAPPVIEFLMHADAGAEITMSAAVMSMPLFVTGLRQIFGRGLRELR
jgi:hypothetical protein